MRGCGLGMYIISTLIRQNLKIISFYLTQAGIHTYFQIVLCISDMIYNEQMYQYGTAYNWL